MNILDKIIAAKELEVEDLKERINIDELEEVAIGTPDPVSFYKALSQPGPVLICEFKRKSPSKGVLNPDAKTEIIVPAYENAGAAAVSVLTDIHFNGFSRDLILSKQVSKIPLLRKDFIIDKFQIFEAKALGASAILLIAAVLKQDEIESFTQLAHDLKLDVLLELHSEDELKKIPTNIKIIGINNRDLTNFKVDIDHSVRLAEKLPAGLLKVSESGLDDPGVVLELFHKGFKAFLIGEKFMKTSDPGKAAAEFIKTINS